jgi:hypothetical protein
MGFKKTGPVEITHVFTLDEEKDSTNLGLNVEAFEKAKQEKKEGEQNVQENRNN